MQDFITVMKSIGLLSTMNSCMPLKITIACKGYPTLITFKRFLSWKSGVFMNLEKIHYDRISHIEYIYSVLLQYELFYAFED